MRIRLVGVAAFLACASLACGDTDSNTTPAASLRISSQFGIGVTFGLGQGLSAQLAATIVDNGSTVQPAAGAVTWSSSCQTCISVDQTGMIRALTAKDVYIKATTDYKGSPLTDSLLVKGGSVLNP